MIGVSETSIQYQSDCLHASAVDRFPGGSHAAGWGFAPADTDNRNHTSFRIALPHGRLRKYQRRDLTDLMTLLLSPDVRRECFDGKRLSSCEAEAMVRSFGNPGRLLLWVVEIQEDCFAGMAGLRVKLQDNDGLAPFILLKSQFRGDGLDSHVNDILCDIATKMGAGLADTNHPTARERWGHDDCQAVRERSDWYLNYNV